ncbi:MAG: sigma-70 family RNA polymerase sigma factor [Leptospirales bacterium]|nr:sigma-70 family RNA polymerase sigma factor [Leptospirales bacterium]
MQKGIAVGKDRWRALGADWRPGDPRQFAVWAALVAPRGRQLAWQILKDPMLAEDALQEALLQAWRKLDQLRHPAASGAWFGRIVLKCCNRLLRQSMLLLETEAADRRPQPDEQMLRGDLRRRLQEAAGSLPVREREIYQLIMLEGLSQEEAAAQTGLSVDFIKNSMRRIRQRLRRMLPAPGAEMACLLAA